MKKAFLILILTVITAFAAAVSPSFSADLERGKDLYTRYCWWCHGEFGEGNGPASKFMNPEPRDFTYGFYKWKSTPFDEYTPSRKDFRKMITGVYHKGDVRGLGGTAMPGWEGVLKDEAMDDVIAYIKSLAFLEAPEKPPVDLSGRVEASFDSFDRGKKLFADNCSECHGKLGRGDATKRLKDDFGVRTWPRNLTKPWTFRAGSDPRDIYKRITVGILGTQMPSFDDPASKKRLSAGQRWDIANYVATLGEPLRRPYPGAVLISLRSEGDLPDTPDDPAWDVAEFRSFYLAPQIIVAERLFTPTVDSISVKSLYNEEEAAFLLEWDDRTESVPGQKKSIKLAEGELFRDGVALEFSLKRLEGGKRPYFGMGGPGNPVRILFWQGATSTSPEQFTLIRAQGSRRLETKPAGRDFFAKGSYDNGRWRVVMKAPLYAVYPWAGASSRQGTFIPVAFAAWDGSNSETGSRHVTSGWHWAVLKAEKGPWDILLWPLVVFVLVFIGEIFIVRNLRKR